jgi:hypothetical protein
VYTCSCKIFIKNNRQVMWPLLECCLQSWNEGVLVLFWILGWFWHRGYVNLISTKGWGKGFVRGRGPVPPRFFEVGVVAPCFSCCDSLEVLLKEGYATHKPGTLRLRVCYNGDSWIRKLLKPPPSWTSRLLSSYSTIDWLPPSFGRPRWRQEERGTRYISGGFDKSSIFTRLD